jgi:hypothetical protein
MLLDAALQYARNMDRWKGAAALTRAPRAEPWRPCGTAGLLRRSSPKRLAENAVSAA